MSSLPPFHQDPESIRVSDREVMAMADLHRRMMETKQEGPSLTDVAQMLGISEYEARALLAQVRKEPAISPTAPLPLAANRSSILPKAVVAGLLLVFAFLFLFRVSATTVAAPGETTDVATESSVPPQPAEKVSTPGFTSQGLTETAPTAAGN